MSLRKELEKVERERARLIALLETENAREDHAKLIIEKTNRLLSDLGNKDTFCQLPLTTIAHVKLTRGSEFCDPDKCNYADTCKEILSLNSESKKKASVKLDHKNSTASNKNYESGYPSTTRIEIELPTIYTLIAHGVISISPEKRRFFPGYKVPFTLETDIGEIETWVASGSKSSQVGDPNEGKYFSKGLRPWVKHHSNQLHDGTTIIIEKISSDRYRLRLKL